MCQCAMCDREAVVALTGVVVAGVRIDFEPPEYRCEDHRDEDADGADAVELAETAEVAS